MWRITKLRRAVQLIFLLLMTVVPFANLFRLDVVHYRVWIWGVPYSLGAANAAGVLIVFTVYFSFIGAFFMFLVAVSLVSDRLFCGFVCPHNTFTEMVDSWSVFFLGRRSRWDRRSLSGLGQRLQAKGAMRVLWWAGGILALFLGFFLLTLLSGEYLAPIGILWRDWYRPGTVGFNVFWGTFAFWVLDAVLIRHLWCKFCPFGAFYQWLFEFVSQFAQFAFPTMGTRTRVMMVPERKDTCIDCNLCEKSCWMQVPILTQSKDPNCISCGACVDACAYALRKKGLPAVIDFTSPTNPNLGDNTTGRRIFHPGRRLLFAAIFAPVVLGFMAAPMLSAVALVPTFMPMHPVLRGNHPRFTWDVTLKNNTYHDYTLHLTGQAPSARVHITPAQLTVPSLGTTRFEIQVTGEAPTTTYYGYGDYPLTVQATASGGQVVLSKVLHLHMGGSESG